MDRFILTRHRWFTGPKTTLGAAIPVSQGIPARIVKQML